MKSLTAVILAAGKGTRMKSDIPKVLFPVAGKPMLQHVIDTLGKLGVSDIFVVVGYGAEQVRAAITGPVTWVEQRRQLGTGHALAQAAPELDGVGDLLVLFGDTPLLTAETLQGLIREHQGRGNAATVLTARVPEPSGYGRIIRGSDGCVRAIVEEKDANPEQKAITEINSGTMCFAWPKVKPVLARLNTDNVQGEYYLTDIFALLVAEGERTGAYLTGDCDEVAGVNDRIQLAWAEKVMRSRINRVHMRQGVTIVDPSTVWIDADVEIGRDTVIMPNTHILGASKIGGRCRIGPNAFLDSCVLGEGVAFRYAVAEQAAIGDNSVVGPFAYIRPGSNIGSAVRVGDFVEIKNSEIGDGTKVPHLAYVGDAKIGSNSNIGCGVITANYDGKKKNPTFIGNNVFVGCNTNLVAPVKIEDGAYIAAGSTITEDVPAQALAIARSRQTVKPDWRKGK